MAARSVSRRADRRRRPPSASRSTHSQPPIFTLILYAATACSFLTEPATTDPSQRQLLYPSPPRLPLLGWRKWMPMALTTAMEFDGTDLVSYAFESTPGIGIQAGAP